jgi:hypothetical protein
MIKLGTSRVWCDTVKKRRYSAFRALNDGTVGYHKSMYGTDKVVFEVSQYVPVSRFRMSVWVEQSQ